MYHYVRELENSKYPDIKGLELDAFIHQIDYLRKNYTIITTEEVIHSIETGDNLPPKSALLTFDDAYTDHFVNVFPILDNLDLQGSFYIPVKAVKEHVVLDVNKIHFILAAKKDKIALVKDLESLLERYRKDYKLNSFEYYYKKLAIASRYDSKEVIFIKRLLQVELIEELRLKIVDELFVKYVGMTQSTFAKELYMNEEQLIQMRKAGMHIGSHGFNHYWWNHLDEKSLEAEIDQSLIFLNEIGVDMENWTACYPYGSFDNQAVQMLSSKGCKLAVTTQVDIAEPATDNRFLLPRLDTNDLPKEKESTTNLWYEKAH